MSILLTPSLQKTLDKLSPKASEADPALGISRFIQSKCAEYHELSRQFEKNLQTLSLQKERCSDVIGILEELGGLTVRARNFVTTPQDAEKYRDRTKDTEALFNTTITKLNKTVSLSTDNGVNLLVGNILTTPFDAKGENSLQTKGIPLDSESLGIRPADFSGMTTVQNSRIDVMNAIDMAVTLRNIIASDISTISIALDFTAQTISNAKVAEALLENANASNEIISLKKLSEQKNLCEEPLADEVQQEILESFASSPNMEDI